MTRIPKKYTSHLFAVGMGLSMGLVMSAVMTLITLGFVPGFFAAWGKSFLGGTTIGIPTALLVSPLVNKLVDHLTVNTD